ncbi:hypothetical protein GCM10022226_58440 [Sphaerisporangium flaviroseum]|uniref:Uncharacterized protein n=1 Tax=Sphaerisporangium flaviroseum TaxID=509199 RepID=A0ABP7IYL1_9ACTN
MEPQPLIVRLESIDPVETEALAENARRLRDEILQVEGVVGAEPVPSTETAAGTRSPTLLQDGALAISIYIWLVRPAIAVIRDFLRRNAGNRAQLEFPNGQKVTIEGHSEESAERLVAILKEYEDRADRG